MIIDPIIAAPVEAAPRVGAVFHTNSPDRGGYNTIRVGQRSVIGGLPAGQFVRPPGPAGRAGMTGGAGVIRVADLSGDIIC
jgi:hypothetical protein